MSIQDRIFWLLVIVVICLGLDQGTKVLAEFGLKELPPQVYFENFLRVEYAENRGAFLSLGAELSDVPRFMLMGVFSGFVLLFLSVFVVFKRDLNTAEVIGYCFILAGGFSNIYDRVVEGVVVDFLNLGFGSFRTGIFNVADIAISIGLLIIVVSQLAWGVRQESAKKTDLPTT